MGILSSAKLSKKLKMLNNYDFQLILSHLSKLNFDNLNKFFTLKDVNKIVNFMISDKKNTTSKINFITLKKNWKSKYKHLNKFSKVKNFIKSELLK